MKTKQIPFYPLCFVKFEVKILLMPLDKNCLLVLKVFEFL